MGPTLLCPTSQVRLVATELHASDESVRNLRHPSSHQGLCQSILQQQTPLSLPNLPMFQMALSPKPPPATDGKLECCVAEYCSQRPGAQLTTCTKNKLEKRTEDTEGY